MFKVCGLSATLGAFRLGALPAIVRRSSGARPGAGQIGGGRGIGGSSFPFPFWAFRSAPSGKGRSLRAPRSLLEQAGWGGVARFRQTRWLRAGGGWSRSLGGGAAFRPWGACRWGSASAWGLSAFFPFGTAIFAPFPPKSQVFPATFAGLSGELPATKRRRACRPFVTKFAVSSPFAGPLPADRFSSAYNARRGFLPPPWAPTPAQLRRFAVRKSPARPASPCESSPALATSPLRPGEVQRFALAKFSALPWRSPTRPPGFPLCRFALAKFSASTRESPTKLPGFPLRHFAASPWRSFALCPGEVRRFAVKKFSASPCQSSPFSELSRFAVAKGEGAVGSPGAKSRRPPAPAVKPCAKIKRFFRAGKNPIIPMKGLKTWTLLTPCERK